VVRTFSQRGDDDATRIVLYTVIAFAYREGTATTGGRQTRLFEPRQDATLAPLVDDDETGTRHFTDARAPVGRPGDRAECVAILYADETAPERPAQQYEMQPTGDAMMLRRSAGPTRPGFGFHADARQTRRFW
jgi:hypothetical protein